MKNFRLTSKKGVLLKNTVMLYFLTCTTYLLGILVVPYETRVLQTEKFGLVGLATAIMIYFQKVVDFGFMLSATEEVSRKQDDREELSRIFSAVTLGKLFLTALSAAALLILCCLVPRWRDHTGFLFLFLAATAINCLIPDYLYRGLEQMEAIALRTVLIKLFFTGMIFLTLRGPEDYWWVPVLNVIGNSAALLGVLVHLYRRLGIRFVPCGAERVRRSLRTSWTFFLSRMAAAVYSSGNTIVMDLISAGAATAFYDAANRLVNLAKSAFQPVSDSLYPYMTKNRDFRLMKKILLITEPVILLGCAVVFIWAEPLCALFFGAEYAPTGKILRALLPMIALILPNYLLGYPTMSPMGLTRYANYAVIFGAAMHVVNLVLFFFLGQLNMVSLGLLASAAELAILVFQIVVILRNRDRMRLAEEAAPPAD